MAGLRIPEDMMGGGIASIVIQNVGFQDPATNTDLGFAKRFHDSGFNVVTTATAGAGQDTQGYEAYAQIKQSGELGHGPTLNAAQPLADTNVNIQEKQHIEVQSVVASVTKDDGLQR